MMLWEQPEREFQYFAMEMVEKFRKKAPAGMIGTYELMILGKSWWDTVDFIAAVLVGGHFRRFPEMVAPYTGKWMASGNIWLQRTALLFQLKYKKETDFGLLATFITFLAGSREFFIRKAIGWALREYSKTDPQRVKAFVTATPLAPLSRKEALRRMK
jgi:3-methyladenine DNA glycosylase AlkD